MTTLIRCIFIVLIFVYNIGFGQVKDSIALANHIPIRCGFILVSSPLEHYYSERNGINIYNHLESDSVFSIAKGSVQKVLKFGDEIFCLIRSGSKVVAYGPFKSSPHIVGDLIKRGDYLGAMTDSDFEDGTYNLLVMVYKRKKYFSFKQHVAWINKQY